MDSLLGYYKIFGCFNCFRLIFISSLPCGIWDCRSVHIDTYADVFRYLSCLNITANFVEQYAWMYTLVRRTPVCIVKTDEIKIVVDREVIRYCTYYYFLWISLYYKIHNERGQLTTKRLLNLKLFFIIIYNTFFALNIVK